MTINWLFFTFEFDLYFLSVQIKQIAIANGEVFTAQVSPCMLKIVIHSKTLILNYYLEHTVVYPKFYDILWSCFIWPS